MKYFSILFICFLLSSCAVTEAEHQPSALSGNGKFAKEHSYDSERFYIQFVDSLNQDTEQALRSKINVDISADYLETQLAFDSLSTSDVEKVIEALNDRLIGVLSEQTNVQWTYVGSELNQHDKKVSYYRATEGDYFAYYTLIWRNNKLVDIENTLLTMGVSSMLSLAIQLNEAKTSAKTQQRLNSFVKFAINGDIDKVPLAYQRLPKRFQQSNVVLSVLLTYLTEQEGAELPLAFSQYMQLEKPVHPRFYGYYTDVGNYQAAIDCLKQLPLVVFEDSRLQAEIASIHFLAGQTETAKTVLRNGILSHPYDVFSYFWLLDLALKTNDFSESELLLNVLRDRFFIEYSRQDLVDVEGGEEFVNSHFYDRYQTYLKNAA
ncbi:hypothetical protein M0C34_05245 [Agarivorans sp. TSD2052]|uniref:tetratricopeptide repeat protein n=1 Tax=Agarivorans sp. TSD2052 TaxID=2937286 RepID=UPI00200FB346|nr:hypothetical protein [Agarivorans sp. TSD2052]UPW19688.1 hypothetical protein M0C34_05245 [Agarivorans sp. TSD2052]